MKPNVITGPIATQSLKQCSLHDCTKEMILEYFENAYGLDEWLFTSLKDESVFYEIPDTLRLPLIFYYAHPAAVFVNKMLLAQLITERVNEKFETLFETGVDEMSWDDTENYRLGGEFKWPTVEEARKYRLQVRELVRKVIRDTPLEHPITTESKWWAVIMGIEHERIHLETSSVLIRQLPVGMVEKPSLWKYAPTEIGPLTNTMISGTSQIVKIGKDYSSPSWGWDNEYGKRVIQVPEFEASKYPITNAEFIQFVQDGGYDKREFWTPEGWEWKSFRQTRHPIFWVCSNGCKSGCGSELSSYSHCNWKNDECEYGLRMMFDEVPLPDNLPVEVNYHEAKAFCSWKGKGYRLPTEAEHQVMRGKLEVANELGEEDRNLNMQFGSSTPVNFYPPSTSGFYDTFGNVWEWIEDHFNGLPGGKTHFLYDDFSSPCYDGKHTMITGGSWASTGNEATRYARYSFRRHFFQHLGFRIARTKDLSKPSPVMFVKSAVYVLGVGVETNDVDIDALSEIGLTPILCDSTCTEIINDAEETIERLTEEQYQTQNGSLGKSLFKQRDFSIGAGDKDKSRALVIGCGPGRLAFELTKNFDEVFGCDTSARCVELAMRIQKSLSDAHAKNGHGCCENGEMDIANLAEVVKGVDPNKVTFKQLTWLSCELGKFDLVIVDGMNRVSNPKAWIARLPTLLKGPESQVMVLQDESWQSDGLFSHLATFLQSANRTNGNAQEVKMPRPSIWKLRQPIL